jgi:hypothetical protein
MWAYEGTPPAATEGGQGRRRRRDPGNARTEANPYDREWEHLFQAIREDKPYNEVPRGVEASLVTAMGRMACHTGKTITRDEIFNEGQEFAPDVDKLTMDSPAPLVADADGKYPVPLPGLIGRKEYQT